jgi:hypothetical protein
MALIFLGDQLYSGGQGSVRKFGVMTKASKRQNKQKLRLPSYDDKGLPRVHE